MAYGLRGAAVATAVAMACIGSAAAQDVKLPGTLTVTAYETGSNAFNQAVAVGQMLKNKYDTDLRVLPAGNDVARLGRVDGLEAKRQNQKWIVPYHAGAVRALKEVGVWTDESQRNNDTPIARQKVLTEAWAAYLKTNPPDDKDAFRKGWMEVRRTALTKAGQPVGFDE